MLLAFSFVYCRPVSSKNPYNIPLILISFYQFLGVIICFIRIIIEDHGTFTPVISYLISPGGEQSDIYISICSLINHKVNMIPVVIFKRIVRTLTRSYCPLKCFHIFKWYVTIHVWLPQTI